MTSNKMKEKLTTIASIIYKFFAISLPIIFVLMFYLILINATLSIPFYNIYMNWTEEDLNAIPNVEVIEITGHEDGYIDGVSARLRIKDKGTISLSYVDFADKRYPQNVHVTEVNGYEFNTYVLNKDGKMEKDYDFNLGTERRFGKMLGLTINSVEDIVNNFDTISSFVDQLKPFPEFTRFEDSTSVFFVSKTTYAPDWFSHEGYMNMLHLDVLFHKNDCNNKEEFFEKLREDY